MNHQFDELTKGLAQLVTRRAALKKFGVGLLAAIAASLGMKNASAAPAAAKRTGYCEVYGLESPFYTGTCWDPATCQYGTSSDCSGRLQKPDIGSNPCGGWYLGLDFKKKCSF